MSRSILLALALLVASAQAAHAEAFVRVLTQRAKVRSGPGADFRTIYVADRGAVLKVIERGTKGYWFKVELDDGTYGWVFGEQVSPFEVVENDDPGPFTRAWRATRKAILGPSPVPYADVELSFSAGVLGGGADYEGLFLFRPAWIIDQYFALEGWGGESPRANETIATGGLGWTLRLVPGGSFGPYANAGVGVARFSPKETSFSLQARTLMAVAVGGGFELTIKKRITLRIDFRNWTFFNQNEAENAQEYTGGLAIFF